jgi:YVTN family beta-propeller protein
LVKNGNYIYVASNTSDALQIINVSNPAVPTAA